MIKKANVRYTVTADMIQAKFTPKVCSRVMPNASQDRNMWFGKFRRKPILTEEDVKKPYKWARTYRDKTRSFGGAATFKYISITTPSTCQ